jgi:hypothetical protein
MAITGACAQVTRASQWPRNAETPPEIRYHWRRLHVWLAYQGMTKQWDHSDRSHDITPCPLLAGEALKQR